MSIIAPQCIHSVTTQHSTTISISSIHAYHTVKVKLRAKNVHYTALRFQIKAKQNGTVVRKYRTIKEYKIRRIL